MPHCAPFGCEHMLRQWFGFGFGFGFHSRLFLLLKTITKVQRFDSSPVVGSLCLACSHLICPWQCSDWLVGGQRLGLDSNKFDRATASVFTNS
jgi:hypothetical protein